MHENKAKVISSGEQQKVMQKAVKWPSGVCGRGVGNNSTQCTGCVKSFRSTLERRGCFSFWSTDITKSCA